MIDPISDMITRTKNAQRAGKPELVFPASKLKLAVAKILEQEKFIESVEKERVENREQIHIVLRYYQISRTEKNPVITDIKRISHEGQRIYVQHDKIKNVKNKYGISIISTSKGVMTGAEARKAGLGGEIICEVW
ncbi:MAG: 30S ribosomal protein S8 [Candidatus Moranbacteria bacterium]|nr:30S ribosomal protein S8 [Candidatus Moranbacteria bacterium]